MSFERQVKRKLDELEKSGELEFRDNETLEEWIRRISSHLPDPWATVKRFIREHDEKRLQEWIDKHKIRVSNNSKKESK